MSLRRVYRRLLGLLRLLLRGGQHLLRRRHRNNLASARATWGSPRGRIHSLQLLLLLLLGRLIGRGTLRHPSRGSLRRGLGQSLRHIAPLLRLLRGHETSGGSLVHHLGRRGVLARRGRRLHLVLRLLLLRLGRGHRVGRQVHLGGADRTAGQLRRLLELLRLPGNLYVACGERKDDARRGAARSVQRTQPNEETTRESGGVGGVEDMKQLIDLRVCCRGALVGLAWPPRW